MSGRPSTGAEPGATPSSAVQKVKLARKPSASRKIKVIEDPQIILNHAANKAAQLSARPTSEKQKQGSEKEQQSLFGLDLDLVKSLQLDNLIEEKK